MHRSLINGILDDPEGTGVDEGVGPPPLLQRSPPQQDLHITVPFKSGREQPTSEQKLLVAHFRVKKNTVPLPRIVLEMTHLVSSNQQVTFALLPSAEEFNAQYWRASVLSSRLQL